jgi:hypothetical protein
MRNGHIYSIPNFKNFLSLHIFVQSLAVQKHALKISEHTLTRNTCMQQPLAYIPQTLFQHEVFVVTSTLNAGARCSRRVSHGNTISL